MRRNFTETMFIYLVFLVIMGIRAQAAPLQPTFSSCLTADSHIAASKNLLNVTQIFAELVPGKEAAKLGLVGDGHDVLRLDLIGVTGAELAGYDNDTNKLATLFTDTHAATLRVHESATWVCNSLFPSNLSQPYFPYNTTYCPLPAGDFAINISIPLHKPYALTTLHTHIRVVDTSLNAASLACYDVHVSPYTKSGWYYQLFLWWPVALVMSFWLVSWSARFITGWIVGSGVAEYGQKEAAGARLVGAGGSSKRETVMRKWGTMVISGLSGERLSVSGGLLRFVTPGVKDIIFHVQYASMLGMIAVRWPIFTYPILSQGAWANLVWNTTLVQGSNPDSKRSDIYPSNYTPSVPFASQISDSKYPLYLNKDAFNPLLDLHGASHGMESFAMAVGLRPQDLFGTCLAIFMCMAAAIIVLSLLIWALHGMLEQLYNPQSRQSSPASKRTTLGNSPRGSLGGKEAFEQRPLSSSDGLGNLSLPAQSTHTPHKTSSPSSFRRTWLRFRPRGEAGAFHVATLYGNLIRLLLMFHLPVTIFSVYQLYLGREASIVSRAFAALAFVFISVLIPAFFLWRISKTPTGKLYDATRTLLSLGPMYNVYAEKRQMFRVFPLGASLATGIVIGAGQKSGLAQAIVIVVIELALLIVPGFWYPWAEGASMGAPNVFLGSLRLVCMLLAMLLSKEISMTVTALDWITYTILILQAIIFVFFLLLLITKIIEGIIRLVGNAHFDESTHPLDGGIFAAIMDLDCLNPVRGGKAAARKRRKRGSRQLQKNVYEAGSLTTQMMLDRHSQGIALQISSEQTSPFLYPMGYQSPLGPLPVDRRSSESKSDERPSDTNIMDAWRPSPGPGYAPPGTYAHTLTSPTSPVDPREMMFDNNHERARSNTGFSVVRGGRSNYENPYDIQAAGSSRRAYNRDLSTSAPVPVIRVSPIGHRPMSPPHSRPQSSSAIIELSTLPTMDANAHSSSPGIRPNNQGTRPPTLAIPKRRSLNDLKNDTDPSSSSEYPDSDKKRRKRRNVGWFRRDLGRPDSESEESDSESGPSRRIKAGGPLAGIREPKPFEDITRLDQPGWKRVLGIKKKGWDDLAEQAKDENKARKAALATESGSLFAGVAAPTPFSSKKGFVLKRSGEGSRPSPTPLSPVLSENQSMTGFKVKRMGQPTPTPHHVGSPEKPKSLHASPASAPSPISLPPTVARLNSERSSEEKQSFKVLRPSKSPVTSPTSHTGFVVNRPSPSTQPSSPSVPSNRLLSEQMGYPPSSFVPIAQNTNRSDSNGPVRPVKDPRRSNESQRSAK
ncbi:hypothetical protein L204_104030 [Cryptococcus depauperatus]